MDPPERTFQPTVSGMDTEASFVTDNAFSTSETEPMQGNEKVFKTPRTFKGAVSSNSSRKDTKVSSSRKIVQVFQKLASFWEVVYANTVNYFRAVFTIPYIQDPITFCRPDDFNAAGERIKKGDKIQDEATLDMIEAACNYSEKTKLLFDKILARRRDNEKNRSRQAQDLDFGKLAPWNESLYDRLESTFRVFDTSGDGVVNFDEICSILAEYGDKSSAEEKKSIFDAADVNGKGCLNFTEFVTMLHTVSVKSSDSAPPALVETFRQIDRNMARIRELDVVQQLQTGLF